MGYCKAKGRGTNAECERADWALLSHIVLGVTVSGMVAAGGVNATLPRLQLEVPTGESPTGGCS